MRNVYQYSHLGGAEIFAARFPDIDAEIDAVIAAVSIPAKTKVSAEKGKQGRALFPRQRSTPSSRSSSTIAVSSNSNTATRSPFLIGRWKLREDSSRSTFQRGES